MCEEVPHRGKGVVSFFQAWLMYKQEKGLIFTLNTRMHMGWGS